MKIRHERPMSDLSFSVRAPLRLELPTGAHLTVESWSLEGLTMPEGDPALPEAGVLTVPFQGVDIRFPVQFAPEPDTRFLRFKGLNGRHRETLALFHRALLSGKMAATEEIITSLDTPVDLVPMSETEEEKSKATAGKTPRSLRALGAVLLYLVFGALVFSTLGAGIVKKLAHVEMGNARVEAQLVPHDAVARGYVKEVAVALGDTVQAGDILVRLSTPDGEAALADVRGRIALIEARLDTALTRRARLADRIAAARDALIAAPRAPGADGAAARAQALDAFDARYSAAHRDLFDAIDSATIQVDSLEDELRRLRRERGRLRDAADALHIRARQDGTVSALHVLKSQLVGPTTPVAVIEAMGPRHARAWLDPSLAQAVYVGMPVSVRITGRTGPTQLPARIAHLQAAVDPALSPDFGMLVTVAFETLDAAATRARLPHQMPVEIRAERRWASEIGETLAALGQRVGG